MLCCYRDEIHGLEDIGGAAGGAAGGVDMTFLTQADLTSDLPADFLTSDPTASIENITL